MVLGLKGVAEGARVELVEDERAALKRARRFPPRPPRPASVLAAGALSPFGSCAARDREVLRDC